MAEWIKVVFDGIGTEIISLIIGSIFGGVIGFRIGKHKSKVIQSQEAGSNAEQYQEANNTQNNYSNQDKVTQTKSFLHQTQKAKDNSKQTQIGGKHNV